MTLLYLETATPICSVALAAGGNLVSHTQAELPHQHASHLTLLIERCLAAGGHDFSTLDGLVLGHGPGSYTGLRVGAAVAKGICLARPEISFYVAPALTALARRMARDLPADQPESSCLLYPTVDSRRGEIYVQAHDGFARPLGPPRAAVLANDPFPEAKDFQQVYLGGGGISKVASSYSGSDNLRWSEARPLLARELIHFTSEELSAGQTDFAAYEPLYIKPPHVTKATKKLL